MKKVVHVAKQNGILQDGFNDDESKELILQWYMESNKILLDYLSDHITLTQSSTVWR